MVRPGAQLYHLYKKVRPSSFCLEQKGTWLCLYLENGSAWHYFMFRLVFTKTRKKEETVSQGETGEGNGG